jgi:hypothetical protein
MAYRFQVTFDCAHPHDQAAWWAEALGWQVEPQDESFIEKMVEEGQASEDDTTTYDGKLVWKQGAAIMDPDEAGDPAERQRVLFQLVPEPKSVKNRVHLDVRVGADAVDTEAKRLCARGATFLHEGREGPFRWVTLVDPEGNELCLT